MTRSRALISVVGAFALVGLGRAFALPPDATAGPVKDAWASVKVPFKLTVRDRTWDGNPHAMPSGRAVLESAVPKAQVQQVWELADVTVVVASSDGSTAALLTRDFEVFVSRLPETPRRIDGGPYLIPALSRDGTLLVAQRLGGGGHILEKTFNTQGIALVNLKTGQDRLLVEGNDLYSPSFASDDRVFFGSGGTEQIASLYLLDVKSMSVARVTNRAKNARQTFPSEPPRLNGGSVVYDADGESFRVPAPVTNDFAPVHRFESPQGTEAGAEAQFGAVSLRTPTTESNKKPKLYQYFDLDRRGGFIEDWSCAKTTYDQHQGTDFNHSYGANVAATASGEVFLRHDGCADTNSWGCGYGFGNHVVIRHSDGTASLEAHGKKWTVIDLGAVACGAIVMQSADSGSSNAYHIHHESWKDAGSKYQSRKFDPYKGSCDQKDPSKWVDQNPYGDLPGNTCSN